jgi:hypothetical protein
MIDLLASMPKPQDFPKKAEGDWLEFVECFTEQELAYFAEATERHIREFGKPDLTPLIELFKGVE